MRLAILLAFAFALHGADAGRNNAGEIVRGGAWLYHENDGPCGVHANRSVCSFVAHKTTRSLADASVTLSVSSEKIDHLEPVSVSFKFSGFQKTYQDWIGAYCVDNEATSLDDRQYIDWQYVYDSTDGVSVRFGPLANMRCSWQFRYFTQQGSDTYVKLATSPFVRMAQGKQQPLHVRVAKTVKATEMRVMWVSAAVSAPVVV